MKEAPHMLILSPRLCSVRAKCAAAWLLFAILACSITGKQAFSEPDRSDSASEENAPDAPMTIQGADLLENAEKVRALVEKARSAVVVISFSGRDGKRQGLGSGVIISPDGLIATNLHVIGEARPIRVQLLDGRTFAVQTIHATEKSQDLAILKIDASKLPTLPLGDADELEEGEPLVAIGNHHGLEQSVVTGVAGIRNDVQGMDMIQLAMPIARGNSGGPVLNLKGEIVGLVTLKSLQKENIGFAVAVNHLKPLLESPNPISMKKWLTIGVVNPRLWTAPDDQVRWTQRSGRIHVTGTGHGFGGRSLCLSKRPIPEEPYEVGVWVKMHDADGAAGLVFRTQENGNHYGFYPSSGTLRLTRFDGPTVYQWHVLRDQRTPAYHEGEWNALKVQLDHDHIRCYCNEELIFDVKDGTYATGTAGLCKFRHTSAEFKLFQAAKAIPSIRPSEEVAAQVRNQVENIRSERPPTAELVEHIRQLGNGTRYVLEQQAQELEKQAERLRQLSQAVHAENVRRQLAQVLDPEEGKPDLLKAALLLAKLDNEELEVDLYVEQVDALAAEFQALWDREHAQDAEVKKIDLFHQFLFEQEGFHGSRTNYYSASNSYLNEVLDDREGLPITLSVLYIELARRCGMDVVGIGLPGHFVVQYRPSPKDAVLIDPFNRGERLSQLDAQIQVARSTGRPWDDRFLEPQSPREIIIRMLNNLLGVVNMEEDPERALHYVETILVIAPDSPRERLFKAVLCLNTNRIQEGLQEVDWVIERNPDGIVMERVHQLKRALERRLQ